MSLLLLFSAFAATLPTATLKQAEEAHVETLKSLAARLATESGRSISVDRALAGLPVFVDRRSMSVDEVADSLALGLRASVVRSDGGIRITRTTQDERKMLAEAQGLWKKQLGEWLIECDKHARVAAAYGSSAAQVAHYNRLLQEQLKKLQDPSHRDAVDHAPITVTVDPNEFSPVGVLYHDIVAHIGIDKLSAVGPEERRIWSNLPQASQLSCPDGDALLDAYARSQSAFDGNSATSGPTRFTFEQAGGIQFRLCVYDGAGNIVSRYSGPPFILNMAGPILLSYSRLAASSNNSEPIWRSLSPSELAVERFIGDHRVLRPTPKEQFPPCLKQPDKFDPLDGAVRLGLQEMASETAGKGFTAILSDDLLDVASGCISGEKINVAAFRSLADEKSQFERMDLAGVSVFRPQQPFLADRQTCDRTKLADQVRQLLGKQKIDMRDIATSYYHMFPRDESHVADRVIGAIVRTQPHYKTDALNKGNGTLMMIGAAMEATGDATGPVNIDAHSEPFNTLINRGINDGWLRFESDQKLAAALLDPAVVVESPPYRPVLAVGTELAPALCPLGTHSDPNHDPTNDMYRQIKEVAGMYASFASQLALQFSPGQPDKLPDGKQMLEKIRSYGPYDLGTKALFSADLFPFSGLRARFSVEEVELEAANLGFDDLPKEVRDSFLQAAMDALDDLVKHAGKPPSNAVGQSTGGDKIPPR